jgi:hypothetical protein
MSRNTLWLPLVALLCAPSALSAIEQTKGTFRDKFRQLDESLPTANAYRTAGGEPGHEYWQQQVDYDIDVRLLEDERRIEASERIRYTNNSPDTLRFLWLQLDQNRFRSDSLAESAPFADSSRRGPKVEAASGRQTTAAEPWKSCGATNSWPTMSWGTNCHLCAMIRAISQKRSSAPICASTCAAPAETR